jgi:hypothetical protein
MGTYIPEHLERWSADGPTAFDSAANYAGADLSDFYVAPVSVTRDSQLLERVNWQVVTADLDKVSQHDETESVSMGHWACGWYEIYLIHADDAAALQAADQWACSLADYPVADGSAWSDAEFEAVSEHWERCSLSERVETLERHGLSVFAARRDELPQDPTGSLFQDLAEGL